MFVEKIEVEKNVYLCAKTMMLCEFGVNLKQFVTNCVEQWLRVCNAQRKNKTID
jgi:hypothetical protein